MKRVIPDKQDATEIEIKHALSTHIYAFRTKDGHVYKLHRAGNAFFWTGLFCSNYSCGEQTYPDGFVNLEDALTWAMVANQDIYEFTSQSEFVQWLAGPERMKGKP